MATLAIDQRESQAPEDARHVPLTTIPVAAQPLGESRSKLYELLAQGGLVRIGRSRRIAIADLEVFVHRCRAAG